jgi:hypothetical protein
MTKTDYHVYKEDATKLLDSYLGLLPGKSVSEVSDQKHTAKDYSVGFSLYFSLYYIQSREQDKYLSCDGRFFNSANKDNGTYFKSDSEARLALSRYLKGLSHTVSGEGETPVTFAVGHVENGFYAYTGTKPIQYLGSDLTLSDSSKNRYASTGEGIQSWIDKYKERHGRFLPVRGANKRSDCEVSMTANPPRTSSVEAEPTNCRKSLDCNCGIIPPDKMQKLGLGYDTFHVRSGGTLNGQGFYLCNSTKWVIEKDRGGIQVLVPYRK